MDRRQKKTREAIFRAFTELLSHKDYHQITVSDIIDRADIGRATFYSHFETKDELLKEFCGDLFCHIFDTETDESPKHHHIFRCDVSEAIFIHLFRHLQHNDHNVAVLLSSQNNELFSYYFRANLERLIDTHMSWFDSNKRRAVPEAFWKHHITSTLADTIKWWIQNGMKESPEVIADYFLKVV